MSLKFGKEVDDGLKGSKDKILALMSFFIDKYGHQSDHLIKSKTSANRSSFDHHNQIGSASTSDILFNTIKLQNQAFLASLQQADPQLHQNTLRQYEHLQRLESQTFNHECVICQEHLEEKDRAQKLSNCDHTQYHKFCLDNWLKVQKCCPICRMNA